MKSTTVTTDRRQFDCDLEKEYTVTSLRKWSRSFYLSLVNKEAFEPRKSATLLKTSDKRVQTVGGSKPVMKIYNQSKTWFLPYKFYFLKMVLKFQTSKLVKPLLSK